MKIHVTHDHIMRGEQNSCTDCPIALAIAEALPQCTMVRVYGDHVTIDFDRFWLSEEERVFVADFDTDGPDWVQPIMLDLAI